MSKAEKKLERMMNNPRDWRIDDLKVIADRIGLRYWQKGTSHVIFKAKSGQKLSIPAHKPIKPAYVKLFIHLIFEVEKKNHERIRLSHHDTTIV